MLCADADHDVGRMSLTMYNAHSMLLMTTPHQTARFDRSSRRFSCLDQIWTAGLHTVWTLQDQICEITVECTLPI